MLGVGLSGVTAQAEDTSVSECAATGPLSAAGQANVAAANLRKWWPETESNCRLTSPNRHEDFQSSALPTELSGQGDLVSSRVNLNEARIKAMWPLSVNSLLGSIAFWQVGRFI